MTQIPKPSGKPLENGILMCSPHFFDIRYIINPWMEGNIANAITDKAKEQWISLYEILAKYSEILFIEPNNDVPDLVFTANAGLVYRNIFICSKFFHKERAAEEPIFLEWFQKRGYDCAILPEGVQFEGAGDALFDREQNILWAGHGFRTNADAHTCLRDILPHEVISLELSDPRFYHLDTCFCPLEGGYLLFYSPAFSKKSETLIRNNIANDKIIEVSESDALAFACNAVNIGSNVIMNSVSESLLNTLRDHGFTPHATPLSEFLKAGGAAKCLTIRLDEN